MTFDTFFFHKYLTFFTGRMQVKNVKNSGGAQSQTLQKSLGPTTVDILYSSYNTVEGDQS